MVCGPHALNCVRPRNDSRLKDILNFADSRVFGSRHAAGWERERNVARKAKPRREPLAESLEAVGVGLRQGRSASDSGRKRSSGACARNATTRDPETTRASTPRASPRQSLVSSSNLRRTRVSTGIRAALDRATRSAHGAPQDGGQGPRSAEISRTTKYIKRMASEQEDGGISGVRFTTPPSPGENVITQAEALARRASLAAASQASAAADAAVTNAATRNGEQKKDAATNDAVIQHPMVGDPGLKKHKQKKNQDVDKSWEKVSQADVDAAAQAATTPAGQSAGRRSMTPERTRRRRRTTRRSGATGTTCLLPQSRARTPSWTRKTSLGAEPWEAM